MQHPFYSMNGEAALALAVRLHPHNPILPSPSDLVPTIPEAIELIQKARKSAGFNWITGRTAEEVLRAMNGEDNVFTL